MGGESGIGKKFVWFDSRDPKEIENMEKIQTCEK